jgi:hypothetical protein
MLVSSKADVTKPKKRTSLSYYALKAPIFYGPQGDTELKYARKPGSMLSLPLPI